MITFKTEVKGVKLNQLESLANMDLTGTMKEVGLYMEGSIKRNFDEQRDPSGNPYIPLSDYTLAQRRKAGKEYNDQALRDTGHLMNSITSNASKTSVEIGTNLEYGKTHQFGDPNNKVVLSSGKEVDAPIPQRKFLGFRRDDPRNLKKIIADGIRRMFKK